MTARSFAWTCIAGFGAVYLVVALTSADGVAWTGWHLVFAVLALVGPVLVGLRDGGWLASRRVLSGTIGAVLAFAGADLLGALYQPIAPTIAWDCGGGSCATNDVRSFLPIGAALLVLLGVFALRRAARGASTMWPWFWSAVAAVTYGTSVVGAWWAYRLGEAPDARFGLMTWAGLAIGVGGVLLVIFLPLYWPSSSLTGGGARGSVADDDDAEVPSPTSAEIADAVAAERLGLARVLDRTVVDSQVVGDGLTQPKVRLRIVVQLLRGPAFEAVAHKWVRRSEMTAWRRGTVHEVVLLTDGAVAFVGGRMTPEQRASIRVPASVSTPAD